MCFVWLHVHYKARGTGHPNVSKCFKKFPLHVPNKHNCDGQRVLAWQPHALYFSQLLLYSILCFNFTEHINKNTKGRSLSRGPFFYFRLYTAPEKKSLSVSRHWHHYRQDTISNTRRFSVTLEGKPADIREVTSGT